MKKLYILTIISSPGRVCVSIILFQLSGSKAGPFESNLFWVVQYDPPPPTLLTFIREKELKKKKKNFVAPFYGWGSTASRLEPLRGGSLLFTTKFPEIPSTHFIDGTPGLAIQHLNQ